MSKTYIAIKYALSIGFTLYGAFNAYKAEVKRKQNKYAEANNNMLRAAIGLLLLMMIIDW